MKALGRNFLAALLHNLVDSSLQPSEPRVLSFTLLLKLSRSNQPAYA